MIEAQRRAEELRLMLAGLEKVDDEGRRSNFLDALYGKEVEDVLNLPEHSSPPGKEEGSLNVELLKHQVRPLLRFMNAKSIERKYFSLLVETRPAMVHQPRERHAS